MSVDISKNKRWLHWSAAVLTACVVAGGAIGYRFKTSEMVDAFLTDMVTRGPIENTVSAVGILEPSRFVDVGVQVSGQLKSLYVSIGDAVTQGQLLAEIDPRVLAAKVTESEATRVNLNAQLKAGQARMDLHAKEHARNLDLLEQDAVALGEVELSQAALATSGADIEALKAQIVQAEAVLATARTNLEYTRITAPIDGTVMMLGAKEGQTLNANQQTPLILRIADLNTITVNAQISEADVTRIKSGQEAYFTLLGQPERRWSGMIRQILPMPEEINNVVLYPVLFEVANRDQELLPRMTAQVFIVLEKAEDALQIPLSALRADRDTSMPGSGRKPAAGYVVDVLGAGGADVESRPVAVGVRNAVAVQVTSGLNEGEKVVIGRRTPAGKGAPANNGLGGGKKTGALR